MLKLDPSDSAEFSLNPRIWRAILGLVCAVAAWPLAAEERHLYRETRGDAASTYLWTMAAAGDLYRITFESPRETFVNHCDANGSTLHWRLKGERIEVQARREGGTIVLVGRRDGEPVERRIEIGDEPWYQPLSYSLRRFVRSGKAATLFWMLRPDTLDAARLKAERAGREPIDTAAGPTLADKVRISTTGLLTGLWKADYWFDAKTGVFLRYEGVNGLPVNPKTVVELVEQDVAPIAGR
jgi:hypothetical protein